MSEFFLTEEDIRRTWDGQDEQAIYEADTAIGSRDIANTHDSNATLRNRDSVKEFYELIEKKQSQLFRVQEPKLESKNIFRAMQAEGRIYMDEQTLEWLGDLPFNMDNDAIPLFEDPETDTDYQLHPCYPRLPIGKKVQDPNLYLHYLYSGEDLYSKDAYVIPLGRLFINKNTEPDERSKLPRPSKWTGYEVFLDLGFRIWIAFNRNSLAEQHYGWYPVACRLFSQDINMLDGLFQGKLSDPGIPDGRVISKEPDIRMGSIGTIGRTNFEDATQELKTWRVSWECLPMVDEVTEEKAKTVIKEGNLVTEIDPSTWRWREKGQIGWMQGV